MKGIREYKSAYIGKLLPKLKKSSFTINRPQNLFEPNWEALKENRCPFCGNKLYRMLNESLRCKSKKHKKSFVISANKLNELCQK